MSAKYTIRQNGLRWSTGSACHIDTYDVLNPSGVPIAHGCSWRVARKIADALNEQREAVRSGYMSGFEDLRGAVSLQEEA